MPIIIHTSDLNLGAPLGWLGPRSTEQRAQLRKTLSKIIDLAIDQHADALLVCGDLFFSNSPSAATVRFVLREFERLTDDSRAHVVLLPGGSDALGAGSLYESYRQEFGRLKRVTVLGLDGVTSVELPEAGMAIQGGLAPAGTPIGAQLASLRPADSWVFNVAALRDELPGTASAPANGQPSTGEDEEFTADSEAIEPSPFAVVDEKWSYLALGGRPGWSETQAEAPGIYPGSPELVWEDHKDFGNVARVELRSSGAVVSKVRVGVRSVMEARVDVSESLDILSVADEVRRQAFTNPQAVLRLELTGLMSAVSGLDDAALIEELAGDYFFVCPPVRDYQVTLSDEDLAQLPERLVVGRFARLMRQKLSETESEDRRREIEDALQLGVSLLQGKDLSA